MVNGRRIFYIQRLGRRKYRKIFRFKRTGKIKFYQI